MRTPTAINNPSRKRILLLFTSKNELPLHSNEVQKPCTSLGTYLQIPAARIFEHTRFGKHSYLDYRSKTSFHPSLLQKPKTHHAPPFQNPSRSRLEGPRLAMAPSLKVRPFEFPLRLAPAFLRIIVPRALALSSLSFLPLR
jgi:hypothetical protein